MLSTMMVHIKLAVLCKIIESNLITSKLSNLKEVLRSRDPQYMLLSFNSSYPPLTMTSTLLINPCGSLSQPRAWG